VKGPSKRNETSRAVPLEGNAILRRRCTIWWHSVEFCTAQRRDTSGVGSCCSGPRRSTSHAETVSPYGQSCRRRSTPWWIGHGAPTQQKIIN